MNAGGRFPRAPRANARQVQVTLSHLPFGSKLKRMRVSHGCHGLSAASTTTMDDTRAPATYRSAASHDPSIPPSKLWTKCVSVAAAKPRATMIAPDHVEPAACTDQSGFDLNKHRDFPGGRERRIDIWSCCRRQPESRNNAVIFLCQSWFVARTMVQGLRGICTKSSSEIRNSASVNRGGKHEASLANRCAIGGRAGDNRCGSRNCKTTPPSCGSRCALRACRRRSAVVVRAGAHV